jgi:hypothetical protein
VAGFYEYGDEPSDSIRKQDIFLTSSVTFSFPNNVMHHRMSE